MLARLDTEFAPMRASVDREGSLLRIDGSGEPVPAARVAAVVEQMGYVAAPIEGPVTVAHWFGADDIDELSQEEARVLAERRVAELDAERVVPNPNRLLEPLRAALLESFRSAAVTGSVDDLHLSEAALRGALDQTEAELVLRWLERRFRLDPG